MPSTVVSEYKQIPSFLVEACTSLEEHIQTKGLFRKSGSVTGLKTLKNKLDNGEGGLSSALPCDTAGLLKRFFRELVGHMLPACLHEEALLKTQQKNHRRRPQLCPYFVAVWLMVQLIY